MPPYKTVQELLEQAKQLPQAEKQQLTDLLLEEPDSIYIPDAQKQFVRNSIQQHHNQPDLLIPEEKAWNIIEQNLPNESI